MAEGVCPAERVEGRKGGDLWVSKGEGEGRCEGLQGVRGGAM